MECTPWQLRVNLLIYLWPWIRLKHASSLLGDSCFISILHCILYHMAPLCWLIPTQILRGNYYLVLGNINLEAPYGSKCKLFGFKILLLTKFWISWSIGLGCYCNPPPLSPKYTDIWYTLWCTLIAKIPQWIDWEYYLSWVCTIYQPPLCNIASLGNKGWYLLWILLILHKLTLYLVGFLMLFLYTPILPLGS